ncbi:MAG: DNA repair protein RecO [Anaerolineaceae bacterium]|nr:DNA repair protein RecO [Anaerolineaceae bacterium]
MTRPERSFRTDAIILKRRDFGEADRLLTILTPRHGKIDVIAKGARKPSSTKTGHVELYTWADLLVHRGRELGIAVQAEVVKPYLALREDLQRGAYANYVAELTDRFTTSSEEDLSHLMRLLDDTLTNLCVDDDPRLAVRYYEMRLLDEVGFRPELQECVISREPIQPEDQYFSYADGGVVRPEYASRSTNFVPIPLVTLKVLRHMQRSPYSHVKSLNFSPALHNDVERILLGYITYTLEQKLQSVDFIRRIRT